jgi:5-methylcytosine-specific restriction endonuclease McrA
MSGGKHGRKDSKWRDKVFYQLCIRDDVCCSTCGDRIRKVWRKHCNGISVDGYRCTMVYCTTNLEVDQIVPLSEGGSNEYDNLWLLCRDCHKEKTSTERSNRLKAMFAEWRELQALA